MPTLQITLSGKLRGKKNKISLKKDNTSFNLCWTKRKQAK